MTYTGAVWRCECGQVMPDNKVLDHIAAVAHQFPAQSVYVRGPAEITLGAHTIRPDRPATTNPADKQPDKDSGKVGDERGSQSPDAAPTSERGLVAGVKTVTNGES